MIFDHAYSVGIHPHDVLVDLRDASVGVGALFLKLLLLDDSLKVFPPAYLLRQQIVPAIDSLQNYTRIRRGKDNPIIAIQTLPLSLIK